LEPPVVGALAQFCLLAALAAGVGLGPAGWLTGIAFALGTCVLLSKAIRAADARSWGAANTVTLGRLILTGGVTALVADSFTGETSLAVLTTLAAMALVLDAVDGQVARRTGTTSALGARFDMEADSVLVLVLSVFVAVSVGWWVLAIGVFRYLFAAATWGLPWLRAPLPPRFSRKVVAAVQGVVLVVATGGLVPRGQAVGCLCLALGSLVWSFGRDVRWLHRSASPRAEDRSPVPCQLAVGGPVPYRSDAEFPATQ